MILRVPQGLKDEGVGVSLSELCRWFGVPRRTAYYKSVKAAPKVDAEFAKPIKVLIEESPSFGYSTVAHVLGFNRNTVQRIFQTKGWQVRKRAVIGTYTKVSSMRAGVICDGIAFYTTRRPH